MFSKPQPTFRDFLQAYKNAILGLSNREDFVEGSIYEIIGGVAAILWTQQMQRDEDLFASALTKTADGQALTDRLDALSGIPRILDTAGEGVIVLGRPNTSNGGGTFWEGTRVSLVDRDGLIEPFLAEVAEDTNVSALDTTTSVRIRSVSTGNPAVTTSGTGNIYPRFEDIIWDTTWSFKSFTLAAGTVFEPASVYRARVQTAQRDNRVGFEAAIIKACKAAGASRVALFPASYAGASYDRGLNMLYVGDAYYSATSKLIGQCTLALESIRMLGDNLQIRPMTSQALGVQVVAYLTDTPTVFNTSTVITRIQNTIAASVANEFSYSLDAFRGAVFQSVTMVQDLDFVTPSSDGSILSVNNTMPSQLTRYTLRPQDVIVTLKGPR